MNPVISPGDWVLVTPYIRGFARKTFKATVLHWTKVGRLKVKADADGKTMVVGSENVKKVADGVTKESPASGETGLYASNLDQGGC